MNFIPLILGIVAELLTAYAGKKVAQVGRIASRLGIAALKASAEIDGAQVDWASPAAVAEFIRSLPDFEPIP